MTYSEIAQKIVELVGGNENISSIMNCMTRLRITTFDKEKVNVAELNNVEKVKGVVMNGNTVQLVLLGELADVIGEVEKLVTAKDNADGPKIQTKITPGTVLDIVTDYISGSVVPVLPALIACGLLQGLMVAINTFHWLSPESSTHQILTLFSNIALYYFPVLVALGAAKKIKTNQFIAAAMMLFLVHPTFLQWVADAVPNFNFFGIPVKLMTYTNNIFPALISVPIIKVFETLFNKIMPKSLRTSFTPFFTLLCALPIVLCIAAPLGGYIGLVYEKVFATLMNRFPILTGAIFGATGSLLVLVGLHVLNINFVLMNLSAFGYDFIWPLLKFSTNILGGLALGAFFKLKDKEEKAYALSAWALAFFGGLSEPSLYGVVVKNKRPMIPMIVLGALNGMLSVAIGVKTSALVGGSWIFSIPAFIECLPQYLLCIVICNIGGAILGYLWGYDEPGLLGKLFYRKEKA